MQVVKTGGIAIIVPRFSAERARRPPSEEIGRNRKADAARVLNQVFRRERFERPDGVSVVPRPVSVRFHDMVRALAISGGKKRALEVLKLD